MRREFLNSNITLRESSRQHSCSYRYVSGLSSEEKWYPKRRELKRQQEEAVTDALVERVAARSSELAKLKAAIDAWATWDKQMRQNHGLRIKRRKGR